MKSSHRVRRATADDARFRINRLKMMRPNFAEVDEKNDYQRIYEQFVEDKEFGDRTVPSRGENGRSPRRARPQRRGAGGCAGRVARPAPRHRGCRSLWCSQSFREFYVSLLRVCCSMVLSSILPRSAAFRVFCIASSLYSSLAVFCDGERRLFLSLRRRNHLVSDVDKCISPGVFPGKTWKNVVFSAIFTFKKCFLSQ